MSAPTTHWIRDNGSSIETTTDVLIDESGNFFVDESGNNLLDSTSSDGVDPTTEWESIEKETQQWADSNEATISESERTTVQGDTRTTVQGLTRVAIVSSNVNRPLPLSWGDEDNVSTQWADANEPRISEYTRTASGDTRTTVQGDTRVALVSATNKQPTTAWSEDEY